MNSASRIDVSIPNVMTCLRIAMALTAGALFLYGRHVSAAASTCIAASALDYFDGWYARKFHQSTNLGAHLDPFADKVLVAVMFITLSYAFRWTWFSFLVGLILVREAVITVYRAITHTRSGFLVPASRLGKIKTTVQCIVGSAMLFSVFIYPRGVPDPGAVLVAMLITSFITVDSGLRYLLPICSDGKRRSALERLYQLIFGVRAREV